jgi:hypothetical protein
MDVGHSNMLAISPQGGNHVIIAQRHLKNVHSTIHLERKDEKVSRRVLKLLRVNVRSFQGGIALSMLLDHYNLPWSLLGLEGLVIKMEFRLVCPEWKISLVNLALGIRGMHFLGFSIAWIKMKYTNKSSWAYPYYTSCGWLIIQEDNIDYPSLDAENNEDEESHYLGKILLGRTVPADSQALGLSPI